MRSTTEAVNAEPPRTNAGSRGITYAYSFDRETFRGRFSNRKEAVEAAESALETWPAAAEAIWVGRHVQPQVPVDHLGRLLIDELNRRQAKSQEEATSPGRTAREDLDTRLAALLRQWLADHELLPAARIEEISEHPLPLVSHVAEAEQAEVGALGVEE